MNSRTNFQEVYAQWSLKNSDYSPIRVKKRRNTDMPGIAQASGESSLNADDIRRYSRHLLLPEVGIAGQQRLKSSSVLVIGAGGLGSPVLLYLAAAGVGKIGVVDMDHIEVSNLQRQIIHRDGDVGVSKADSAKRAISALNPSIQVEVIKEALTSANAFNIARDYDVIIDGTDNFPTRYLVNDLCVLLGKPSVYGSILKFEGQASVFWAKAGACYRCLYPEPPPDGLVPNCAEGGVVGVLPGMIGTIQANEAIKLLLGVGEPLINRLLTLDALSMKFREFEIQKNPDCPVCGAHPTISELIDYQTFCGITPITDNVEVASINCKSLHDMIHRNETLVIDVRSEEERRICQITPSVHIPLAELPDRIVDIPPDKTIVIYCKSGIRGKKAVRLLNECGLTTARNLDGGILRWIREIDQALYVY